MTEVVASLQLLLELQEKHDNSAESSGKMRFAWKIHKYLVPTTKQNSDQSGSTSSQKNLEDHMNLPSSINKDESNHGETMEVATDLKKFTYADLEFVTRNFGIDTLLVYKDVEEVFKGWVDKTTYSPSKINTGLPIAVRRFRNNEHGSLKKVDLDVLKELNHPNLVKLIGCCIKFDEVFLVYEFMPNRNFLDCLRNGTLYGLPLVTKVKIAVGIARGMVFLKKKQREILDNMYPGRVVNEGFKDYVGARDSKRPSKPQIDDVRIETISEYQLDRCKIMLDEKDFTAKLSNFKSTYDFERYMHKHNNLVEGDYYPGY
ncbi:Protein kinase, catalytic domain-containing protein, partial [Cynara cardunculus var. scolymus]